MCAKKFFFRRLFFFSTCSVFHHVSRDVVATTYGWNVRFFAFDLNFSHVQNYGKKGKIIIIFSVTDDIIWFFDVVSISRKGNPFSACCSQPLGGSNTNFRDFLEKNTKKTNICNAIAHYSSNLAHRGYIQAVFFVAQSEPKMFRLCNTLFTDLKQQRQMKKIIVIVWSIVL